jgi:ATP/maltotriose-dependent transcriptional regulator MalT
LKLPALFLLAKAFARTLKNSGFSALKRRLQQTSRIPQGVFQIIKLVPGALPLWTAPNRRKPAGTMGLKHMNKDEGQLIHEKIAIPDDSSRVSRLRLLDLLDETLASYNATIIHGRAGTGKTMLAADFARRAGRPVAWYKVDAADSDLRVFYEYLLASITLQRPSINQSGLMHLAETVEREKTPLLAEALVFQLSESKDESLLIVIEDLHLVHDADWVVPFFRRLLPLLPADVHVLITCRSLPPAPLWRLRSKQMLRVVDEAELAFTLDEAVQLFETYGLAEEHARIAMGHTNGRAAAIAHFAATPGRAGRAVADSFLAIKRPRYRNLIRAEDFQT